MGWPRTMTFAKVSLCQRLEEEDWITRTWEINDSASAGAIAAKFPEVLGIIEQSRIPFISYPYEWSFDMLKDAALHTLDLLLHSGQYGFTLKDATAYNVQFLGCRPIFIDILSIAKYVPGTPWAGYTQFCQQFLFPLALTAHRGVHFQHFLRSYLEGIPLHVMKPLLGGLGWRKAGMFKHVILQSFFQTGFQADNPALKSSFQSLKFSLDHVTALDSCHEKGHHPIILICPPKVTGPATLRIDLIRLRKLKPSRDLWKNIYRTYSQIPFGILGAIRENFP